MNTVKRFLLKLRVKRFLRKLKPGGSSQLSKWGNLYSMSRIMYQKQCVQSCDYYFVGISGTFLGYPEKDEYLRKRITETLKGEKQCQ